MDNVGILPFSRACKDRLRFLVDMILQNISDVEKIVLFGSYARFEQTASSDLDILVLTEKDVPRELRGGLCSVFDENNADLVFYTVDRFQQSSCLLVKKIKKDGVLLWKN